MWASSAIRWNFKPGQGEIIEWVDIDGERRGPRPQHEALPCKGDLEGRRYLESEGLAKATQ